jgi:hypothetical protein
MVAPPAHSLHIQHVSVCHTSMAVNSVSDARGAILHCCEYLHPAHIRPADTHGKLDTCAVDAGIMRKVHFSFPILAALVAAAPSTGQASQASGLQGEPRGCAHALRPANTNLRFLGIDVSHYQASVNWNTMATSGVVFAYIKATEGSGTTPRSPLHLRMGLSRCGGVQASHIQPFRRSMPVQPAQAYTAARTTWPTLIRPPAPRRPNSL